MDRSERRRRRKKIIKKRTNLLVSLYGDFSHRLDDLPIPGRLSNGSELSKCTTGGLSIKTNTRKGHSNYRRPGGFGPADNYKGHDRKMISDMDQQEKEYKGE